MASRWVFRNSDGLWMVHGLGDAALIHAEPQNYSEVLLDQNACPDPRLTRGQADPPYIRAATAPEQAAVESLRTDTEIDNLKALQALARATFELKSNAWTLAQFRDRMKQIYRAL